MELLGREVKIIFVKNITGKGKDSPARYQVQVESVPISREIRDKFGTFFPGGKDSRPDPFKKVSVRNRLTHESRVRINIMRVLGQHWHASNPGSKFKCIGYESRPTLKLFPGEKAKDRRVLTMNFIEAVRSLPEVKPKWHGKLRSLFVVLTDDMIKRKARGKTSKSKGKGTDKESDVDMENEAETQSTSSGSARSGSRTT